jgi:hypothetical protein
MDSMAGDDGLLATQQQWMDHCLKGNVMAMGFD